MMLRALLFSSLLTLPLGALQLKSSDFSSSSRIPDKFSCHGDDASPALTWDNPPRGTQSFALILEDQDAPSGSFIHWIVFNLPANVHRLPESVPKNERLPDGSLQGRNDFGNIGYGGPCPPGSSSHRYIFTLYALNSKLHLAPGAGSDEVLSAIKDHILAKSELSGRYR